MALFDPKLLSSVVAIGVKSQVDIKWVGTGFLVGRKHAEPDIYNIFLITNKHVISGLTEFVFRLNTKDGGHKDYYIDLKQKRSVYLHENPDIDVVAIVLDMHEVERHDPVISFIPIDTFCFTTTDMEGMGIYEGDQIFILGYPIGFASNNYHSPIVRFGIISRIMDVYRKITKDILIDCLIYPGNSGSPVITKPEFVCINGTNHVTKTCLVGIVKSSTNYIQQIQIPSSQIHDIKFSDNMGISQVVPAEYIIEAVERCYNQIMS